MHIVCILWLHYRHMKYYNIYGLASFTIIKCLIVTLFLERLGGKSEIYFCGNQYYATNTLHRT